MKSLFKIHPFTYLFLLVAFLTGYFKDVVIISLIILVHEMGHILAAIILKWKIKFILFLPFGSITIFNEIVNKPLNEELLIAIMGPVFQIIFTLIIDNSMIYFYSRIILIINLLPIYPLDGSKIVNIFLNKISSFKLSHILTIYLSYMVGFILLFYAFLNKNLIMLSFTFLLIIKLKKELDNHNMLFNIFIYERYVYNFNFKKLKIVMNYNNFKRDYHHFIRDGLNLIDEKDYLRNIVYKSL